MLTRYGGKTERLKRIPWPTRTGWKRFTSISVPPGLLHLAMDHPEDSIPLVIHNLMIFQSSRPTSIGSNEIILQSLQTQAENCYGNNGSQRCTSSSSSSSSSSRLYTCLCVRTISIRMWTSAAARRGTVIGGRSII